MAYPELIQLSDLQKKHGFTILKNDEAIGGFIPVKLKLRDYSCYILVEDEYRDFDDSKPLLSLFLLLNSLANYQEATDYLSWCKFNGLDVSKTDFLEYYKGLATIYRELEQRISKIEPFISPFDYQLRSGAFYALVAGGF